MNEPFPKQRNNFFFLERLFENNLVFATSLHLIAQVLEHIYYELSLHTINAICKEVTL